MAEFSKELFLQALDEWGSYPAGFRELSPQAQAEFLKEQGYASLRELLTHVAAWWEEGRAIIADVIKNGDKGPRKYDLDAFNAASLARFKSMPEVEFPGWYEAERQRMIGVISNLTAEQLTIRRVKNWANAVVLLHLKEHGLDAPRFLVTDMLQREWADYRADYASLAPAQQQEFLQKQGFTRFRDVLAHVTAWWEEGIAVIQAGSTTDPCDVEDVDAFNAQAVRRFGDLEESRAIGQFEETRLTLANLVDMLPEEIISRPNIQEWLRADVIDHYYEHAV